MNRYLVHGISKKSLVKAVLEDENNVEQIAIDVPAMIINDRTMLPLRAISETLHANVNWDAANKTVEITMEYDSIDDFCYERARVYKDNKYGYINTNRELVIPLQYDGAERFKDGVAPVKTKDG